MTGPSLPLERVTLAAVLGLARLSRRVLTTEVREDGGLEVGSDFGSGARWSDSSYILKPLEFADGPGVGVRD